MVPPAQKARRAQTAQKPWIEFKDLSMSMTAHEVVLGYFTEINGFADCASNGVVTRRLTT
jgi:hypothetical protein